MTEPDTWRAVAEILADALTDCDPEQSPEGAERAAAKRANALRVYWTHKSNE